MPDPVIITNEHQQPIGFTSYDPKTKLAGRPHYLLHGILLIGILIVLFLGLPAIFFYFYLFNNPERILFESFKNLSEEQSFRLSVRSLGTSNGGSFSGTLDYFRDTHRYSALSVDMPLIAKNKIPFHMKLIYNKNDVFLFFPSITNQKWFHTTASDLQSQSTISGPTPAPLMKLSEKDLIEKIKNAVHIRSSGSVEDAGLPAHLITIGLRKQGLLDLIDYLNATTTMKYSDVKELKTVVAAVDNWDSNLFEVKIDKESRKISSIRVSLPAIPKETLQTDRQEISSSVTNPLAYVEVLRNDLGSLFASTSSQNTVIPFARIEFTDYNEVPQINPPHEVVELH